MTKLDRIIRASLILILLSSFVGCINPQYEELKADFLDLPIEKKLTMPLFWQHGEEDDTLLNYVDRLLESGAGGFVVESRPHPDWLGEEWYADCKLVMDYANSKGLKTWIFDEKWWPSFVVDGKVPLEHRARKLECSATEVSGSQDFIIDVSEDDNYIASIAGKITDGLLERSSLTDLSPYLSNGELNWEVPDGKWKVMVFTWAYQEGARQVDLATQSSTDWFIDHAIKPHYDYIGEENIQGFFYDEPQWSGNWGIGMQDDTPYWKEMMVGQFFELQGSDQARAQYTFWETLIERIGRVGFGSYRDYVNSRGGKLTGHFIEEDAWHNNEAGLTLRYGNGGALNIMELEKYNDMPAMDLIGFYGMMDNRGVTKDWSTYQLPKLISSIAISNDVEDHLAMCEIFGAAGWGLSYEDMKWWGDWCQVHGVNVMDPHSFNPKGDRANSDTDCPPYFYYTGDEENWPKYQAWCERQNRLAYMLTGNDEKNYHVAPVAMLWTGYSKYAQEPFMGDYKNDYPYSMQSALDRVHYDHNLLTYSKFESNTELNEGSRTIDLYHSKYEILILPPVEIIPLEVMKKVEDFYDMGGVVIAWQRVPSKAARFGQTDEEVMAISKKIWKSLDPSTSFQPINSNTKGGKSYIVTATDEEIITEQLRGIMDNSGIKPDFKVVSGTFEEWTHYNHRVRNGLDVFMLWNGAKEETQIVALFKARGTPEIWNPDTKDIVSPPFRRTSKDEVQIEMTLPGNESVLVVFK